MLANLFDQRHLLVDKVKAMEDLLGLANDKLHLQESKAKSYMIQLEASIKEKKRFKTATTITATVSGLAVFGLIIGIIAIAL